MKYAIRYEEILAKTIIVEANNLEEAKDKVWDNKDKINLDYGDYDDCIVESSKYANPDGTATENQIKLCEKLEDLI